MADTDKTAQSRIGRLQKRIEKGKKQKRLWEDSTDWRPFVHQQK
jgi:hypothetical protein